MSASAPVMRNLFGTNTPRAASQDAGSGTPFRCVSPYLAALVQRQVGRQLTRLLEHLCKPLIPPHPALRCGSSLLNELSSSSAVLGAHR